MAFQKQVGEVGVAPLSTNRLAEAGPQELGGGAGKEDVVRILHCAAQGARPITWTIAFEDLDPRGKASSNPLPQENPNLKREANVPNEAKGLRGQRGGDCRV